ncbi:biotin transporter BioY [Devosia sp. 67-54]|nr:biotin transporter BioY [Devosia sp. 67-54]MBN9305439.1 biotin transporter BioY [Devosia sp.]
MTTSNTLLETFQPRTRTARLVGNIVLVVLGTALLTLSAKFSVPVWPVPVTLQTAAVAALAAAFGWRIGVATVAAYILEGLAGLPVFAGAVAGPAYLLGPTGGFIVSWLAMAAIIGVAADRGLSRRMLPLFAVMLLGDAVSFAVGYGWLVTVLASLKGVGIGDVLGSAFDGAIKPFVVWDILKMALAAVTISAAWAAFRKRA